MSHLYGEELAAGAWVDRWRIEGRAAQGGSSILYRARQTASGEAAALKVLRAEYGFSASALRRFHQEVELLGRLHHPHVVTLLSSGELEDGRPWLAMEWVEGATLATWLDARGRLEVAEALPLIEQLCGALEAVHAAGLVHRDLNASNVLVRQGSGAPQLVLVDFGIARLLDGKEGSLHTSTGRVLGTPLALAPEQIRAGTVDARTDIYALGVLLYQLLSGQLPFRAREVAELMEQHLTASVPPLAPWALVPPAVEGVVRRCMAKQPEERFAGARQVVEALRAAMHPPAAAKRSARAVALYVELVLGPGGGAATLERLDVLWERARSALEAAGLSLKAEGAGMLLAVAPLPAGHEAELVERSRLFALARELDRVLEETRQGEPVWVGITVHAAEEEGAELFHPARWALPGPGVRMTRAAREGLEDMLGAR